MNQSLAKSFKNLPRLWVILFMGVTLAAAVVSFVYETYRAKASVTQYVAIWEDDIAKAKLFQGDPGLQNKILKQMREVHTAVTESVDETSAAPQCVLSTKVPVTYNSLPAGFLNVCFGPIAILKQGLGSPLFLGSVLLGLIFLGLGWRRELLASLHAEKLQAELRWSQEIATMARQVAHDIRGPLTALTTLSRMSHEMSTEKKELLGLAVSRIQGVAEDLLRRGQESRAGMAASKVSAPDLATLIESLLKEYRFSHPAIAFSWHKHVSSETFVEGLDPVKFQRVLSNLLNNAIEAAPAAEAAISLTLMERSNQWLIQLLDNGCGIPEEILPTLGCEGRTYGKAQGSGLGLYDARKTLESLGGELQIRSRVGEGTQVILILPKSLTISSAPARSLIV